MRNFFKGVLTSFFLALAINEMAKPFVRTLKRPFLFARRRPRAQARGYLPFGKEK
jgi:hypothetical protein